ncbi:hypothetical protein Vadar_027391 [Vaccinium darrowii]|uniref:Uncharacterized protein n=1 Tax=Vaccinium darrowii TaxID=229202 RepID=A0ACB7Z833_9ERIC|nr:hypothetical protein Vadar_027391 [Vaccinium darrowii]
MRELAAKHATLASAAIDYLSESDDEDVQRSRRALVDLTHRFTKEGEESQNNWREKFRVFLAAATAAVVTGGAGLPVVVE